jgi:hypothetical protein
MRASANVQAVLDAVPSLQWPNFRREPQMCSEAKEFAAWVEEYITPLVESRQLEKINQAKVLLQDKYYEWTRQVGKGHRQTGPNSIGHPCLYQVWHAGYMRLHATELAVKPYQFQKPPKPPKRQPGGIYLVDAEEVE